MYADGKGNVTISPRAGRNHIEPLLDSSIKVELLAGSGISDGTMTANVKYTIDSSVISASSDSTDWVAAWQEGKALDSTSQSAEITQHDNHDQFTFDLTKAVITSAENPYVSSSSGSSATASSGSATGTQTGSGSTPTSGSSSGDGDGDDDGDSGSSGSSSSTAENPMKYQTAHGVLMATSFVVLLPLGAIIMNLVGGVWLHAIIQMVSLLAIIAAFGIGIHLAQLEHEVWLPLPVLSQTHISQLVHSCLPYIITLS
jgi:hypothetical protein